MPDLIAKTCIKWQVDSPFFAEFLLRFSYKEDRDCPTAGIEFDPIVHKINFIYNPDFLEKQSRASTEGLCVHEIMHVLHKYGDRLGDRNHEIFNISQDACINELILETTINGVKLVLPTGGIILDEIRKEFDYDGDPISEPVYDAIYEKADKIIIISTGSTGNENSKGTCPSCGGTGKDSSKKDKSDGEPNSKNSNDSLAECPVCGGTGKVNPDKIILRTTDDHSKSFKKTTELERAVVEDIINNAKTRSWGSISGNMKSNVAELIKTNKIPWQNQLSKFMSKFVSEPGNIYENTWSKRNRRGLPLPGVKKLNKKILITIDTSGSVSTQDLQMFFGQVEKIVKDYSSITLIQWDTSVKSTTKYKKGDWKKIKINGRGGTDPQDLYNNLYKLHKDSSVVVNFTDAIFDWNFVNYKIPSIWVVINNEGFIAPFGKTIEIKKAK